MFRIALTLVSIIGLSAALLACGNQSPEPVPTNLPVTLMPAATQEDSPTHTRPAPTIRQPAAATLPTYTPTPTQMATPTPNPSPTNTPEPSPTPAPTQTAPSPTLAPAPTATLAPTMTPTPTHTPLPTATAVPPTATPVPPTATPILSTPTLPPTPIPTATPTPTPTNKPTPTSAQNLGPPFTLSGTVRDSRRQESIIVAAVVRIEDGGEGSIRTGHDGQFRLENLQGTVTVRVTAEPRYIAKTVEVTMNRDRKVDVTLEHTGSTPYSGTVFISPKVLTASDPTSLKSVTYTGRGDRYLYDRRSGWGTVNAYLFDVEYANRVIEFQVNPEFGNSDAARSQVDRYAAVIGRVPSLLLTDADTVWIHRGDESWGGGNRNILIHADTTRDEEFIEEALIHEGTHTSLDDAHELSEGWRAAQEADGTFISEYAQEHPFREDVAESFLAWFAVRYHPERLAPADLFAILDTIPNRLAYFDAQGFDVSPYVAPESTTLLPAERPLTIRGTVTGPDGQGLEAILIWAWQGERSNSGQGRTGADGAFVIGVPDGSFTLDVYAGPECSFVGWYDGSGGIATERSQAFRVIIEGASLADIEIRLPAPPEDLPRIEWCAP